METFYCICGLIVIYAVLSMVSDAEKVCKVVNTKPKHIDMDEYGTLGCFALLAYTWFWVGLFTSQWFICAIFIIWGAIEMMIKKIFSLQSTPRAFIIGGAIDIIFVLAIVVNSQWLHIDLYQKFINIF